MPLILIIYAKILFKIRIIFIYSVVCQMHVNIVYIITTWIFVLICCKSGEPFII